MTTTPANARVEAIREGVRQSYQDLNTLLDSPLASLAAAKLYVSPVEGEWTIMQNLAHMVEFMPYWGHEIEKLVANPGQNFGRTMQHEGRLRAVEEYGKDNLEHIRLLLPTSYAELERVLNNLNDSDLALTGHHVKFGEKSLDWFIEEFVTKHLSDHVYQIETSLRAVQ